jgi:beta-glucosidase
MWDRYTHTYPNAVVDGTNGDVAADFYHKYKEDIKRIKDLGVRHLKSVS